MNSRAKPQMTSYVLAVHDELMWIRELLWISIRRGVDHSNRFLWWYCCAVKHFLFKCSARKASIWNVETNELLDSRGEEGSIVAQLILQFFVFAQVLRDCGDDDGWRYHGDDDDLSNAASTNRL